MLSLSKLENYLARYDLVFNKIYCSNDNTVMYIEIIYLIDASIFILYIPSKYSINAGNGNNVYLLKEINEDNDDIAEEDKFDLSQIYEDIDVDLSNSANVEENLQERYKKSLKIKDDDDKKERNDLVKQLTRFSLCVENITYKLAIAYKHYLYCIRRDNSIDGFIIKDCVKRDNKSFLIIVDLETIYQRLGTNNLMKDLNTVKIGVYKILDKNQAIHTVKYQNMIIACKNVSSLANNIQIKKHNKNILIKQQEAQLQKFVEQERQILLKIEQHNSNSENAYDMNNDIMSSKFENELHMLNKQRQEIMKQLINTRSQHDSLFLQADKVFFENIVHLDGIIKNINDATQ